MSTPRKPVAEQVGSGEHVCGDVCRCPQCGGPLFYDAVRVGHACVNARCAWIEREKNR